MTNAWSDFNDAKQNANLIPKGTIAKVGSPSAPAASMIPAKVGQAATHAAARRAPSISTPNTPCSRVLMRSGRSGR